MAARVAGYVTYCLRSWQGYSGVSKEGHVGLGEGSRVTAWSSWALELFSPQHYIVNSTPFLKMSTGLESSCPAGIHCAEP
jgi:hypothetical protein